MFKKKEEETAKFVKVPQVEIDGELYHESAEVAFGIVKDIIKEQVGIEEKVTRKYTLKKYVLVRDKIAHETAIRTEFGSDGREVVKNQLVIEMKKEVKRLEEKN